MPVHVNGGHWALLIGNVASRTVGIADTHPSAASATFIRHFKAYMASRATVTAELPDWSDAVY